MLFLSVGVFLWHNAAGTALAVGLFYSVTHGRVLPQHLLSTFNAYSVPGLYGLFSSFDKASVAVPAIIAMPQRPDLTSFHVNQ